MKILSKRELAVQLAGVGFVLAAGLCFLSSASCSGDSDDKPGTEATGSTSGNNPGKGGSSNTGTAGKNGNTGSAGKNGQSAAGTGGITGGGQDCDGKPCNVTPTGLLNPEYTTEWNPGILEDTQLNVPLDDYGLPVRDKVCASPKPGDDLNAAIKGCEEGQVVQLAAGKYTVSSPVEITKGVVLRGAGSGDGGTVIVRTGGGSVIQVGSGLDQACYAGGYETGVALTASAMKETSVITVGAAGVKGFKAGDLALVDQVDDATVQEADCTIFKRIDKRSITERVEIASVDAAAGTLTLSSPLHWTFKTDGAYAAQIAKVKGAITRWAGVENLALQGGTNPDYPGKAAGGIEISNAAYSWVRDVQTDGTIGGAHVDLTGTYRVVVRDGYFHHSADYGFGHDCYGIVLRCGAADNLIENNVVRYMNKPLMMNVSGGGNVMGYNYADNSWADPPAFQEMSIDNHCSFPHMELMEGNIAPHMGSAITHGNAGYLTYFRNYSSSQFAAPPVAGSTAKQTGNISTISFDAGNLNMTVVGNVLGSSADTDLGTAPLSKTYFCYGADEPCIFWVKKKGDIAETSLWAHGNYDTVNKKVMWAADNDVHELPPSLYLKNKPAWWPAGSPWPWAGSDLTPMVGTLPAHERAQAL